MTFVCLVASFVLRRILRSPLMATVNLSLPDSFEGDPVDAPQWAVLAADERNLQVTPDSLEDGDLVAFEDRQSLSHDWPQRPVYVLVDDENIYLCDDSGALINESDTPGGVQTLDGDDGFMAQWREGYYRIPPKAAGGEGGESGGEGGEGGEGRADRSDQSWASEADYSADVDDMIVTGNRVRFSFGGPAQGTLAMWYGALVGVVLDEEAEFAFDDGDYRCFRKEDLQGFAEARTLASWPSARGGLVENEIGYAAAAGFIRHKDRGGLKTVGVLVGMMEDREVYGQKYYQNMHVDPRSLQSRRGASTQPFQDRYGYHTFKRGDIVEYREAEGAEMQHVGQSVVWGVCVHEGSEADDQSRKFLVLHELASQVFFVAAVPAWQRVRAMLPR